MGQQLWLLLQRTRVAPSTHTGQLTRASTLVPWESDTLCWSLQAPAQNGAHTYTRADRQASSQIKIKHNFIKRGTIKIIRIQFNKLTVCI